MPPRKKKLTNLTGVAKNQNVAKTQKKQTSERKQKNGHTKKSFLFSTQALKGVVFFCSTRFFKKKKRRQKEGKGLLLFLALRPWQNLFKMSAAFFAFLIIPLLSLFAFQNLFFVCCILSNFAHSLIVFGLITEFLHQRCHQ